MTRDATCYIESLKNEMHWYNHRKYATAGSAALAVGIDISVDGQDAILPIQDR